MALGQIHHRGPWQQAFKATNALCEDGIRRTATITSEPDTFFSIPARVHAKGKTITGFVTGRETDDGEPDVEFIAYSYGKNGHLLKGEST